MSATTREQVEPKLRLLELYPSFQGEGPFTGRPTLFVRFAGCNFKCEGWKCDTPHAIKPELYRQEMQLVNPIALGTQCLTQYRAFKNICLTGGEPFLQNKTAIEEFTAFVSCTDNTVEVFTNGNLRWPKDIGMYFDNIMMDWKLPGSGETPHPERMLEKVDQYGVTGQLRVKFTIKDRNDYEEAFKIWDGTLRSRGVEVWAGAVWGAVNTETLTTWMLEDYLPWNLNVQVHKFVWNPDKRGV